MSHAAAPPPEVDAFIEEMAAAHRFDRAQLRRWFAQASVQEGVLIAMAQPATARPWYEFRAAHVTEARVQAGLDYWRRFSRTLARASAQYGVPAEILVATLGLETFYGRRTGKMGAFNALYTLAFHYPPRAELFRGELEQLLLLARELKLNPLRLQGSYAGALGIAQFLPGSYRNYAVDFDRDGRRDLWTHADAIGSVANFYQSHGWQPGAPVATMLEQPLRPVTHEFRKLLDGGLESRATVGAVRQAGGIPEADVADDVPAAVFAADTDAGLRYWLGFNNFYVITRYNRSVNYALAVNELARELVRARQVN